MTNNSPKSIEKQINEAWSSIVMKMKKNSEDLELTQDIALNSALQSSFRENRIFQFTDVQTPNISWDLDIKINYDKKDAKWNELKKEFDKIVIAIKNEKIVQNVCNELKNKGVPESKIIWDIQTIYD